MSIGSLFCMLKNEYVAQIWLPLTSKDAGKVYFIFDIANTPIGVFAFRYLAFGEAFLPIFIHKHASSNADP